MPRGRGGCGGVRRRQRVGPLQCTIKRSVHAHRVRVHVPGDMAHTEAHCAGLWQARRTCPRPPWALLLAHDALCCTSIILLGRRVLGARAPHRTVAGAASTGVRPCLCSRGCAHTCGALAARGHDACTRSWSLKLWPVMTLGVSCCHLRCHQKERTLQQVSVRSRHSESRRERVRACPERHQR